jgi:hypothetical protein
MLDLPPPDPGIEIVIASRGMSKGVAQTEGPQLVPRAYVKMGAVQVGAQWKNVSSTAAGGEGAAFINFSPKIGEFQLNFGISHKFQTGVDEPTDDHSWEFTGGISRKVGKLGIRATVVYSPDDLGSANQSVFAEGGPTIDLGKTFKLSANIGRRHRANGPDYTAFNAGLAIAAIPKATLDVRWHGTNRHRLGEFYYDRVVVSARMAF